MALTNQYFDFTFKPIRQIKIQDNGDVKYVKVYAPKDARIPQNIRESLLATWNYMKQNNKIPAYLLKQNIHP